MAILVIDIGGNNVKLKLSNSEEVRKFPSGPTLTPHDLRERLQEATADWHYDRITIGYPGPVVKDKILKEPVNLGPGWMECDFGLLGKPWKLINDAAMQALGSYEGGRMLFLGLGTGLGSAMVIDKVIVPMELAHLPYKKGRSFEEYVGARGLRRLGKKQWRKVVDDVVARLKAAVVADYVILGGGNAKKLKTLPDGARLGDNRNAFLGGFRLWQEYPGS